jgi:hypothetical protein
MTEKERTELAETLMSIAEQMVIAMGESGVKELKTKVPLIPLEDLKVMSIEMFWERVRCMEDLTKTYLSSAEVLGACLIAMNTGMRSPTYMIQ